MNRRNLLTGITAVAAASVVPTFGVAKPSAHDRFAKTVEAMRRLNERGHVAADELGVPIEELWADLAETQQKLFDIAQRNGAKLEDTISVYVRTARAQEHLNLSRDKLLRITETVMKSFRVGPDPIVI